MANWSRPCSSSRQPPGHWPRYSSVMVCSSLRVYTGYSGTGHAGSNHGHAAAWAARCWRNSSRWAARSTRSWAARFVSSSLSRPSATSAWSAPAANAAAVRSSRAIPARCGSILVSRSFRLTAGIRSPNRRVRAWTRLGGLADRGELLGVGGVPGEAASAAAAGGVQVAAAATDRRAALARAAVAVVPDRPLRAPGRRAAAAGPLLTLDPAGPVRVECWAVVELPAVVDVVVVGAFVAVVVR